MVKRIGGFRRKTRSKLKKSITDKGKISITRFFQVFEQGQRVILKAEPDVQKGMYLPRFHGKSGIINGKAGNCYKVQIKDINKEKTIIVHPIHLKATAQ